MHRLNFSAAGLAILSLLAGPASATTTVFSDDFETVSTALDNDPNHWQSLKGTVDTIAQDANNHFGVGGIPLTCAGLSHGCVDLDGSSSRPAVFATEDAFTLEAGKTYTLSADVSGNQRNAGTDTLQFGFISKTSNPLSNVIYSETRGPIASDSPYTLYSLTFTATQTAIGVRAFFYNLLGGGDNQGLMLDNVTLTAVPLPAAAWLFLSGLIALGAVARRRRTNDDDHSTGALAA